MSGSEAGRRSFLKAAFGQQLTLWLLFFLICMGLGYPTLNRYDPRTVPSLYDANGYFSTVTGGNLAGDEQHRMLVPYLARPVYWLVKGHLGTWNPIAFALLASNSFFVASTAFLLFVIGRRVTGDHAVALISAFVYLASFAVANWNLAGYVDSAVNCMILAVVWTLFSERWWPLPLWGILGAISKETFVPLSAVLAFVWWLTAWRRGAIKLSQLAWVVAMVAAGFAALTLVMSRVEAGSTPMDFASGRWSGSGSGYFYLSGLLRCLFARETFYAFGWLLPLGVWRLGRLPRPWVLGSTCAALTACALGAYDDALGNYVRAVFSAIGPLLSLSAAILLVEIGAPARVAANSSN
jgi:hypothetical protein